MIAYHIHDDNSQRPAFLVSRMTQVLVEMLKDSIKESFAKKFPGAVLVSLTSKVTILGETIMWECCCPLDQQEDCLTLEK